MQSLKIFGTSRAGGFLATLEVSGYRPRHLRILNFKFTLFILGSIADYNLQRGNLMCDVIGDDPIKIFDFFLSKEFE